ncbi:hypothetical protein BCR36DRAFT_415648 [Piromyces finnis]|uniref:Uncharacterized protein n=1 Tax=Piromyces finnis TaxID=1754191 RepID=A0A1Y1UY22_9FUNG|nr:hypothetical protein BCR36DRAFT_415648 [Piromyces finnis]|eukprot:ORX43238.1 hypothetical protein BCR36DRAFT_415648 [Piromyces finnis]
MSIINDVIIKSIVKLFYNNINMIESINNDCFVNCYINKKLFNNHKSQNDIKDNLLTMRNECKNKENIPNENKFLKYIAFKTSNKEREVELNIEINERQSENKFYLLKCKFATKKDETLNKIAQKIKDLSDEDFRNSIDISELNLSENNKIKTTISSNNQFQSECFYIYHIIMVKYLEIYIGYPFSTISTKRGIRGTKDKPSKIYKFLELYKKKESNELIYYLDSFIDYDESQTKYTFKDEIKYKIELYNYSTLFPTLNNVNSNQQSPLPQTETYQSNYPQNINNNVFPNNTALPSSSNNNNNLNDLIQNNNLFNTYIQNIDSSFIQYCYEQILLYNILNLINSLMQLKYINIQDPQYLSKIEERIKNISEEIQQLITNIQILFLFIFYTKLYNVNY